VVNPLSTLAEQLKALNSLVKRDHNFQLNFEEGTRATTEGVRAPALNKWIRSQLLDPYYNICGMQSVQEYIPVPYVAEAEEQTQLLSVLDLKDLKYRSIEDRVPLDAIEIYIDDSRMSGVSAAPNACRIVVEEPGTQPRSCTEAAVLARNGVVYNAMKVIPYVDEDGTLFASESVYRDDQSCPVFSFQKRCDILQRFLDNRRAYYMIPETKRPIVHSSEELLDILGFSEKDEDISGVLIDLQKILSDLFRPMESDGHSGGHGGANGGGSGGDHDGKSRDTKDFAFANFTSADFRTMAVSIFCTAYCFCHILFMGDWAIDDLIYEVGGPDVLLGSVVKALISSPIFSRRVSEDIDYETHIGKTTNKIRSFFKKLKIAIGIEKNEKNVRRLRLTTILEEIVANFGQLTDHCADYPLVMNPLNIWFDPVAIWTTLVVDGSRSRELNLWDFECRCEVGTDCICNEGIFPSDQCTRLSNLFSKSDIFRHLTDVIIRRVLKVEEGSCPISPVISRQSSRCSDYGDMFLGNDDAEAYFEDEDAFFEYGEGQYDYLEENAEKAAYESWCARPELKRFEKWIRIHEKVSKHEERLASDYY
jgi:hypothetical protein